MRWRWLVQILHPLQKSERPPFWTVEATRLKSYGVEVTFNGMTFLLSFMKIYLLLQKLLTREKHTDRQHGDFVSLAFLF
jgi:NADH:ubiquinone oxidoreductase subunit H